jgi:hypothetical protein
MHAVLADRDCVQATDAVADLPAWSSVQEVCVSRRDGDRQYLAFRIG